jgi:glutathione S-transferase
MKLVGVNRSPFTRRVAITLEAYGMPYEQLPLSGFNDRAQVRTSNPLGRIPALIGDVLVDSGAIVDYLDEAIGRDRALTPVATTHRRSCTSPGSTTA